MRIKNLLCAAAVAGMFFTSINDVKAANYNVDKGAYKDSIYIYESNTSIGTYVNCVGGTINRIYVNLNNVKKEAEESIIIYNTAYNGKQSAIYNITGSIIDSEIYTFINNGMSEINNVNITADNNIISNMLIGNALGTIYNIDGTYTNNNGGVIIGGVITAFENIQGTYKNNNSLVYYTAVGLTNKMDVTIENNKNDIGYGAISNYGGYIGQLSGSIKNNSNNMEHGGGLFNYAGLVGITTKNGKNTVFEGNTTSENEGNGIFNLAAQLAFNTDKTASIIINDKITGNAEYINKIPDQDGDVGDFSEEDLNKIKEAGNYILINPSKEEDFFFNDVLEGVDLKMAIPYLDLNKTTGVVQFNNLVSDQNIYVYDGTLKLGSWTDKKGVKHYGDFDNVNLNLVGGTLNTIDKEIRNINVVNLTSTNGKLSVDLDLSNNTADTLTAELVNGTFDFNNINFIGTPVNTNGTVQIITGNIGEQGVSFKDFTTFDSNFDIYTITDAGNGYVNYQYSKGDGNVTLKMVVDYANGDRAYNMKKDEVVQEDLMEMAGEGSTLTVNANGHKIDGNGKIGIIVNNGQTLSINNAVVENFNTEAKIEAGGVVSNIGHVENLSGRFKNNYSSESAGVLYNVGTVNKISGTFENNVSDGDDMYSAGVITNLEENAKINEINGTFKGNSANNGISGVITNAGGSIGTIAGSFENNSAAASGAISNIEGNIDSINANFKNNTSGESEVASGAIINYYSTIDSIKGTFEGNSATTQAEFISGAITNVDSTINEISGTFKNNSSSVYGGAITNMVADEFSALYGVEGTFENNSAMAGGAIFNMGGLVNIVAKNTDTVFTGNKHLTGSNAIVSVEGMVNLNADTDKSIIFNDTVGYDFNDYVAMMGAMGEDVSNVTAEEKKDFYNEFSAQDNMININAMKGDYNTYKAFALMNGITEEEINNATEEEMAEFIKMADEEIFDFLKLPNYNEGTIQFNNTVKNSMVNMVNGTLKFGTNTQDGVEYVGGLDEHSILNVFGGTVSLQNGGINNANLGNVQLFNDMNLQLDADLKNETIDTISANSFNVNNKQINITNINLLSPTTKETLSLSPLSQDMDATTRQEMAKSIVYTGGETAYSPIYKYNVEYDPTTANLNFGLKPYSAPIQNFNPAVVTKPVAQQGAQNVQMDSYTEAFRNMDMFMLMPENERIAYKYRNKYAALTDDLVYDPTMSTYQNNTAWFRPYTTFENVPLKNGPKVSNVSYGTYFGYDSSLTELGKGWDGTFGVYAGYNGSHQSFQGNSIYQNGGSLGVIGVAYKGNFFSGWTLNVGASAGSTSNMYGNDNFTSIMGGLSTKNGYNFEFADGKIILQPSVLLSYALVNTFDYTNAAGVRLKSDPLHTLQIEPSIKLIGNIGTWQPYANVAMVWNVLNETEVTANNVKLPEVSVKPYVKYGVGLQKKWADKFTAFGQCYVTNGGRNGVGLQAGLRIALGDETTKAKAAWLNPKKKDTVIVLDGKVK